MAGKGKRKTSDASKKKPNSAKSESRVKTRCVVDIFSEPAMDNAYSTCHNIMDVLKNRGFPWPDAKKKKGKKR